eukprot:TRINITY_DN7975_c0_g2_i1.p1 TRINITY_DN7975_c0_g2~~TRINITY_DN7975_c0_g2_i1.p1  ORF type:complete len:496 (-),score=122.11 TRINITY_DN7975_c0_g2_i1:41-1438(-)
MEDPQDFDEPMIPLHETTTKFPNQHKPRDPLWAVLFIIQIVVMFSLAIHYYTKNRVIPSSAKTPAASEYASFKVMNAYFGLILFSTLISAGLTAVFALWIVRKYSNIIIWTSLIGGCASTGLLAVMFFFTNAYGLALIMLLSFGLSARWVFIIRDRIPFTVAMLEIVLDVMKLFPATILMSLSSILMQAVWNLVWIVAAVYAYGDFVSSTYSTKVGAVFVYIFLILSYYWTSQVVWNSVLVTINGIFAEWYFKFPNMEPRPLKRALTRALTTSFGSVCLGSFLIAIVKTLKYVLEQAKKSRNNWATCIVRCILSCLEGVIEYINLYAFTYVAIYGLPYCEAARNVWQLLETRGFDIIVNDDLVAGVLLVGSVISGVIVAGVNFVVSNMILKLANDELFVSLGFFVGFVFSGCALKVIHSGSSTILVSYAEDPSVLQHTKPASYDKLTNAFHMRYAGRVPMFTFKS